MDGYSDVHEYDNSKILDFSVLNKLKKSKVKRKKWYCRVFSWRLMH